MAPGHFLQPLLAADAPPAMLVAHDPARPLATTIETAFDSASRKRGLLGRTLLARDTAFIIAPCSAIHTFSMRFPIDVIFVTGDGRVLKIRHDMPASRTTMAFGAFAAIEMAAGEAERHGLHVGDCLRIQPAPAPPPPA